MENKYKHKLIFPEIKQTFSLIKKRTRDLSDKLPEI